MTTWRRGLRGFLPGQVLQRFVEQVIETPSSLVTEIGAHCANCEPEVPETPFINRVADILGGQQRQVTGGPSESVRRQCGGHSCCA